MPIAKQIITIFTRLISAMTRNKKDNALAATRSKLQKEIGKIFINQGKIFIEQFDVFENRFTESIKLKEIDDGIRRSFDKFVSSGELNRLFDNTEALTNNQFVDPLNKAYTDSLSSGANAIASELGEDIISFNLSNQRAENWITRSGAKLITNVNETSRFQIKRIVRNGVNAGDSYDEIAAAITKRYKEFAIGKPQLHVQSRAHLVALTETGNAYEAGSREAALQANEVGLTMEKKWSTTGDNKVSEGCLVNEDESWILINTPHASGHQSPLRFPGCRCAELYRRKKE